MDSQTGSSNLISCVSPEIFDKFYKSKENSIKLQSAVLFETYLNCSGFCNKREFYYYSDINKGLPKQRCFEFWRTSFFSRFAPTIKLGISVFVLSCGVAMLSACWMIRTYEESEKQQNSFEQAKQFVSQMKDSQKK